MTVRVDADYRPGTLAYGEAVQNHLRFEVLMAASNRFRIDAYDGENCIATIVGDGRRIVEWDGSKKQWTEYPQSESGFSSGPLLMQDLFFSPASVGYLMSPYTQSWIGNDSPYIAHLRNILEEGALRLSAAQSLAGKQCHILKGEQKHAEKGWRLAVDATLGFDQETFLPVLDAATESVSALLFVNAYQLERRYLYERMAPVASINDGAFRFDAPDGSQFVDPVKLLPAEDSKLVGKLAPAAVVYSLDGDRVELSKLVRDRPILLVFWGTWCAPCKGELADLAVLDSDEELAKRVEIVAISTDNSAASVRSFLTRRPLPYSVLHDKGQLASVAFGIDGVPATFVIDTNGIVRGAWTGWSAPGLQLQAIRGVVKDALQSPKE